MPIKKLNPNETHVPSPLPRGDNYKDVTKQSHSDYVLYVHGCNHQGHDEPEGMGMKYRPCANILHLIYSKLCNTFNSSYSR